MSESTDSGSDARVAFDLTIAIMRMEQAQQTVKHHDRKETLDLFYECRIAVGGNYKVT